ncbi:MAG: hypothetical protein EA375_05950 [Acholeplasmataceae bacterium]|nr:MAG: hypothetical protein EA375_05950 [Acholeplasmataceae bacterium]
MERDLVMLKAVLKADYERHINKFALLEARDTELVLLGDSMLAYYPVKRLFRGRHVINQGIPGDTTEGVLNRLEHVVRLMPKQVVLHAGTNDFVLLEDDAMAICERLITIKDALEKAIPKVRVLVVSALPIHPGKLKTALFVRDNAKLTGLNQWLESHLPPKQYVDLSKHVIREGALDPDLTTDGLHLNDQGYAVYHRHLTARLW